MRRWCLIPLCLSSFSFSGDCVVVCGPPLCAKVCGDPLVWSGQLQCALGAGPVNVVLRRTTGIKTIFCVAPRESGWSKIGIVEGQIKA